MICVIETPGSNIEWSERQSIVEKFHAYQNLSYLNSCPLSNLPKSSDAYHLAPKFPYEACGHKVSTHQLRWPQAFADNPQARNLPLHGHARSALIHNPHCCYTLACSSALATIITRRTSANLKGLEIRGMCFPAFSRRGQGKLPKEPKRWKLTQHFPRQWDGVPSNLS